MINNGDTAWVITATALILLMAVPSLALFYGGLVQAKNLLSVLAQCFAITCLCSILWFICGYSLTFSGDGRWLGNFDAALLEGLSRNAMHLGTHVPESAFVTFEMMFAVITPALMVGAYVERIKFSAALFISGLWLLTVYVPVAHWIWGGGWLAERGVMDYAGGIVVHVTAGVSAIMIAVLLGARSEFPHSIRPPHAPWMVMVGAALLWVGWFGFNAGSAFSAGSDAGMALLATHLSAASATLTWMSIEWARFGKPSLVGAVTGTIAGLACITPASGYVGPGAAILLGVISGATCFIAVMIVKRHFRVDDALDVLGVHGVGGALGAALLPFMTMLAGGIKLTGGIGAQFSVQVLAIGAAVLWSAIVTLLITKLAIITIGIRVDRETETVGLDFACHGESSYHIG